MWLYPGPPMEFFLFSPFFWGVPFCSRRSASLAKHTVAELTLGNLTASILYWGILGARNCVSRLFPFVPVRFAANRASGRQDGRHEHMQLY
jgi:hypothetical protein